MVGLLSIENDRYENEYRVHLDKAQREVVVVVYLTADGQSTNSFWYRAPGSVTRYYLYHLFIDNYFVVLL
jgi:hypothetical protein